MHSLTVLTLTNLDIVILEYGHDVCVPTQLFNLLTVTPPFLNRHENAHFELKWL